MNFIRTCTAIILIFSATIVNCAQKSDSIQSDSLGVLVFKQASPSVVLVRSKNEKTFLQGSGIVFRNGFDLKRTKQITWVVTNAHVTSGNKKVEVSSGENLYTAEVVYLDEVLDLAIILILDVHLPVVQILNSTEIPVGEQVFTIGSPLGFRNSISEGIISGHREIYGIKMIQTTAPISSGNSGGGLFDKNGELLGITTFKIKSGENLNFAISSKYLNTIMDARIASFTIVTLMEHFVGLSEWIETPDRLTKWLMTATSNDGRPMHSYFNEKIQNIFQSSSIDSYKLVRDLMEEIVNKYEYDLKEKVKVIDKQVNLISNKPNIYRLNCSMFGVDDGKFHFDLPLFISPSELKVNYRIATFTSDEIIFFLGKDSKYEVRLNRFTGIATTGTKDDPILSRGKCIKVGDKQF